MHHNNWLLTLCFFFLSFFRIVSKFHQNQSDESHTYYAALPVISTSPKENENIIYENDKQLQSDKWWNSVNPTSVSCKLVLILGIRSIGSTENERKQKKDWKSWIAHSYQNMKMWFADDEGIEKFAYSIVNDPALSHILRHWNL